MKKIPSLFKRAYDGNRQVYDEVVEESAWVLSGEGVATEKLDGTACMVRDGDLYKRYDAKKGKTPPQGFVPCEDAPNEHTGHWPGWVPVGDGPDDKWHRSAELPNNDGTYELVGPKVNGNPYEMTLHCLIRHGSDHINSPRDFYGVKEYLEENEIEGIVWHHPDGRMAKIKARDFGIPWPRKK